MEINELIKESIMRDMSEGVMVIGMDGIIEYINPAAENILGNGAGTLVGRKFATAFFGFRENDSFNQTVLDAIYDTSSRHHNLVSYYTGTETKQLHVMTSFLMDGEKKIGVIVVLGDITELAELKIRYAQQITVLLDSLVKALSTAIDERSHYNANHTKNMVRMGAAFLEWLERTGHPWKFDEEKKRAFLMSVWLHDVGKLVVPLTIMDKATRLGPELEKIEGRFEKIHLLDRIAALEGRITQSELEEKEKKRAEWLSFIRQTNTAGFLSDEDLAKVQKLGEIRYLDESQKERPVLTEKEVEALSIRKGTLTDDERTVMQSHASVTGRILAQIDFPDAYAEVPKWAASHHELLNGTGYPNHRQGETIPREVRLLTILDIFEALTAKDRPYKKPMPLEKALGILHSMVGEGSLDKEVLDYFEESRAWEGIL